MLADNADRHLYGGLIDQMSAGRCSLIEAASECSHAFSPYRSLPRDQPHRSMHQNITPFGPRMR